MHILADVCFSLFDLASTAMMGYENLIHPPTSLWLFPVGLNSPFLLQDMMMIDEADEAFMGQSAQRQRRTSTQTQNSGARRRRPGMIIPLLHAVQRTLSMWIGALPD